MVLHVLLGIQVFHRQPVLGQQSIQRALGVVSLPAHASLGRGGNLSQLRSTPNGQTDCFATFHKPPGGDLNNSVSFAAFIDEHVEFVTPYPTGNTFIPSWPGNKPGLVW